MAAVHMPPPLPEERPLGALPHGMTASATARVLTLPTKTAPRGDSSPNGPRLLPFHHLGATYVSCTISPDKCPIQSDICRSDCLDQTNCEGAHECYIVECTDPAGMDCAGACDTSCDIGAWVRCESCNYSRKTDCPQCASQNTLPMPPISSTNTNVPSPNHPFPDLPIPQEYLAYLSQFSNPAAHNPMINPQGPLTYAHLFAGGPASSVNQGLPLGRPYNPGAMNMLPPQPEERAVCLWGACRETFPSHNELVAHVNSDHLGFMPVGVVPQSSTSNNPLACHWADCGIQPGIPQRNEHEFASISVLANHLLQDHLGFPLSTDVDLLLSGASEVASKVGPISTINASPTLYREDHGSHKSSSAFGTPQTDEPSDISSPFLAPSEAGPSKPCPEPLTHVCKWVDCGTVFCTVDDLSKHVVEAHVGSGKGEYHCLWEGCERHGSRAFSSKQKILRHLQSHTGHRPFECPECGQHFSEAATLQQHRRRHTSEKPYACDHPGCGKTFAVAGALTIHKRTHSGHKPFKCHICERAFAESSNLSKHLRTHSGVKPYACPEPGCDKRFSRPDQLTRHRGVHSRKEAGSAAASSKESASTGLTETDTGADSDQEMGEE